MNPRWYWLILAFIYFIIAVILYSPSLGGPWQYDDYAQILDTKVLTGRSIPTLLVSVFRFTAWPDGWTGTRDFVRATFRLNWEWWGLKPAGYRWVNLGIHVTNAWLVSLLVSLLLSLTHSQSSIGSGGEARIGKRQASSVTDEKRQPPHDTSLATATASLIPIFSGLLFLVHPIQSQAVAYVAQRFASVATMFFVGTIIFFLLYISYRRYNRYKSYIFYCFSILFALLAYNSKEITMTLPVALLLVALAAKNTKLSEKHKKMRSRFSGLFAILAILPFFLLALKVPLQVMTASARGAAAEAAPVRIKLEIGALAMQQEKPLITRKEYFLTELNVVRTYLRLLVLPIGQTLDWDYPITHALDVSTVLSALLHLGLIGTGVWLLIGVKRLLGLGILWFYLTISVESSIIPIPDVFYEHRVYLPFVGVAIAMAGFGAVIHETHESHKSYVSYVIVAACLLILSVATMRRAYVWGDEVRLWADAYHKAPNKPRANKNYGVVLAARGNFQEGITRLTHAVELEPQNADYWSNLGTAYLRSGDYEHASKQFERAFALYQEQYPIIKKFVDRELPADSVTLPEVRKQAAQYLNDFGVSMVQLGRGQDAKEAFERSLVVDPTLYAAKLGLGAAENLLGDIDGAIAVFSELVKDNPDQPDAYGNLATMYSKAKRYEEALATLRGLKKLSPNFEGIDGRIAAAQKAMGLASETR